MSAIVANNSANASALDGAEGGQPPVLDILAAVVVLLFLCLCLACLGSCLCLCLCGVPAPVRVKLQSKILEWEQQGVLPPLGEPTRAGPSGPPGPSGGPPGPTGGPPGPTGGPEPEPARPARPPPRPVGRAALDRVPRNPLPPGQGPPDERPQLHGGLGEF